MASRKTKSHSIRKKNYHLTETDLARAVAAPAERKRGIIQQAVSGTPYDHYKGIKDWLGTILNLAVNPLLPASPASKETVKTIVARACIGSKEVAGNEGIADGLYDWVAEHNVTSVGFDFHRVTLGRAGARQFWQPYLLNLGGKKYIPFFDFRQEPRCLTAEARRFVFSVNHSHICLGDPTQYGDAGLVIFQFGPLKNKVRKAIAHFDTGISFFTDKEINAMVDEVYRLLDDIKKAA
ncbi:MAG: hypothetical protein WBD42_09500 [Methylovirgula sp.]